MAGLYIHIPFCLSKCRYCDFYSIPCDEDLMDQYVKALCRELVLRSASETRLDTVYMGGGTPTTLTDEHIKTIIRVINGNYDVSRGAEYTVEANPGTLSQAKAELLIAEGVNRISIGVQSFDDADLRALGRAHCASDAVEAIGNARSAGFDAVSMDLIYGIPNQTSDRWQGVLDRALDLRPQHLSAYELTPEKQTPLYTAIECGTLTMPDDDVVAEMHETLVATAETRGYEHYEISNFALPGYGCRHNLNYWDRGDYLGIGAAAHSCAGNVRSSNVGDVRAYIERIQEGLPVVEESRELSQEDVLTEYIFLGLRKTGGIDLRRLPEERRRAIRKAVEDLHGLVIMEEDSLRLTKRGILLSNEVIARVM